MRAVSFVSRLVFEFKGNVSKNAICLGDADNDNDYELAIGNLHGDMAIFKGNHTHPFFEAHDLGMIMVIVIGDVLNEGKNSTICISGEGLCSIFEIKNENLLENERKNLQPFHVQRLPANTKVALLADVDNDGELELVLGLTDHVLRTYRWVRISQNTNDFSGKLVGLHKLELADQIGSISLNPSTDGTPYILVAQSGGTYINFQCCVGYDDDEDPDNNSVGSKLTTPVHHPLASSRMRNPGISSEILGNLHGSLHGKPCDSLIAVATLDGTIMLVNGDETLWSFQVDHQLFAITKMDLTGDGDEDIIACAWDGQTYMVNQRKQSVRFQFEESVSAFTSGKYSVTPGSSVPVLIYATFSDRVYLYYDIMLPSFPIHSFFEKMEQNPMASELLTQFPIDKENKRDLANLYKFCLYGFPADLIKEDAGDTNETSTAVFTNDEDLKWNVFHPDILLASRINGNHLGLS
ncbi:KICSTOR complex protein ITFG2 [Trichonephila clavata]|uniref:KICSTOR complex protein ITFG2 n=1 Tax=Trichonephila clavata TaxID=2740835 RepID=A0A8X6GJ19_TRICU|nr:KICSTOR complex protein ITFG2 [Trichonephila clavata]